MNSEKAVLQQQIEQQREASSQEIAKAQKQIAQLKKRNEQRSSAVQSITIMYKALLNSFNGGKYDDARSSLQNVNLAIEKSIYKNDSEFVSMKSSLVSISNALETIDLLQKQVSQQSQAFKNVGSTEESKELKAMLETEKEKIALLEKEIADLSKDSESTKKLFAAREKELKNLNSRYTRLENQYKSIQTEVNKNMQIIVNYLMLKKQSADESSVASLKALVDGLVKKDKYYGVIGVLLAQDLDPSGQLQF